MYLGTVLIGHGTSVADGRGSPGTTDVVDASEFRGVNGHPVKIYLPEEGWASEVEILKKAGSGEEMDCIESLHEKSYPRDGLPMGPEHHL